MLNRYSFPLAVVAMMTAGPVQAESGVPVDPEDRCQCNDQCSGSNVCVMSSFGIPVCCPRSEMGCPADPGPGIECSDAGFDGGPDRPDAGPGSPRIDASTPLVDAGGGAMDAGTGSSAESGCSIGAGPFAATPALSLVLVATMLARVRRRR